MPAGTGTLLRFILRRDRVRLTVWIVSIVGLVAFSAASVIGLYPDDESLRSAAATIEGNAAVIALSGPAIALDTLGGRVAFELGAFGYVIVALMNVFLVGRHTRGEEETGAAELLRAAPIDPRSPIVATLVVAVAANLVVGAATVVSLVVQGLPTPGSVAYGAAIAGTGMSFGALTLVAAQVSAHVRAVYGMACGAVAVAYVVRAVGDVGATAVSWLSPIGWGQAVRAYGTERWWVLALPVVATLGQLTLATALGRRRDHGAGLVQPRPGPAHGAPALSRPVPFAWRLQRSSVLGWAVGLFLGGVAYGSVAKDIDDYVRDNPDIAEFLAQTGDNLVDTYLGTMLMILAVIAGGFAIGSVLRLRGEETANRAEPLLAACLDRVRWAVGGLVVTFGASALLVVLAGLGSGVAYAISIGDASQVGRVTAGALTQVPAVWALAALAAALFGLWPRGAALAWAGLAFCAVVAMLGELFDLPRAVRNLSPFEHLPRAPAGDVTALPLVLVLVVTFALVALGLTALRHRDINAT